MKIKYRGRWYPVIRRKNRYFIRVGRKLKRIRIRRGRVGVQYRKRTRWIKKKRILKIRIKRGYRYAVRRGRKLTVRFRRKFRIIRCRRGRIRVRIRRRWKRVTRPRRRVRRRGRRGRRGRRRRRRRKRRRKWLLYWSLLVMLLYSSMELTNHKLSSCCFNFTQQILVSISFNE